MVRPTLIQVEQRAQVTARFMRKVSHKYIFDNLSEWRDRALLWLIRDEFTLANFSLIYSLVVLIIAMRQGIWPSLFAALLSFLCFNFFLVRPFYTFLVADPRELLDLVVFFIAASLSGRLASFAREQAENARRRADEQNLLYELTSALNQTGSPDGVFIVLKEVLHRLPLVTEVGILPWSETPPEGNATRFYLLMRTEDHGYGILHITFALPPNDVPTAVVNACAIQATLALQRIDLTERAQQSRNFEEADRLKTALLRAVSHDLRTPLTIIKTSISNLLNLYRTLPDADREDMLKTIEAEADQLNRMVGNLLDISRLEAGAMTLDRSLNSLEEVAGDVAARAWQLNHRERIKMIFPAQMPLVAFDYGLIMQALGNLVENALRYELESTQVEIEGSLCDGEARVAIRNHGPDILPEERQLIMEPFFRGKGGNLGLGLAIAKGIIETHCGALWLEDTPGGGATFVFSLPLTALEGDCAR